jgi:hypothetical protein
MGLAPMRLVVAAFALVPSAASAPVSRARQSWRSSD